MRDYGKVHTKFWSSKSVRDLSEDGRILALYLLTSPHSTIAGVFRLPDGYVCEDIQWSPERVAKGFAELFHNGFANRCETSKWVWICKHLEWNPPENPNQRKSAAKMAISIPDDCAWKPVFMRDCGELLGISESQKSNPSVTLPKPFLNQEQEQEQEQEGVTVPANGSGPSMAAAICIALRSIGMARTNPGNPLLAQLISDGADIGAFVDAGRDCVADGKPFAYLLKTVQGRMGDAKRIAGHATKPTNTAPGAILPGAI
jgi:hypothetical protein